MRNSPQPSSLSQHSRPQLITSDANKSTRTRRRSLNSTKPRLKHENCF
jgi:hypothetical protein